MHFRPTPLIALPVLYLSGPMTGKEDYNFPAFNELARKLRLLGFPVLNPADFGANPKHSWEDCLRRDIATLMHAEVMVLLPGWEASQGASLEVDVAIGMGLRLIQVEPQDSGISLTDFIQEHFRPLELLLAVAEDDFRQGSIDVEEFSLEIVSTFSDSRGREADERCEGTGKPASPHPAMTEAA